MNPSPSRESPEITCQDCDACCCQLEVMLICDRDIPPRLTADDRWGGQVMRRLDDGWCAALDRDSMRCTIYAGRPDICRDFAMGDSDCVAVRARYYTPQAIREPS